MSSYPIHWWSPIEKSQAASWEILPQDALPGEVILSKRNELGLLSNFAATPFVFRKKKYASIEGFWQSLLYPENKNDERARHPKVSWTFKRSDVENMIGFDAKNAGKLAKENMRIMNIDWVSFEGKKMSYRSAATADHYNLIVQVMREKMLQNKNVRDVLLETGNLRLRPDHQQEEHAPPAWKYFDIWMQLRSELQNNL